MLVAASSGAVGHNAVQGVTGNLSANSVTTALTGIPPSARD